MGYAQTIDTTIYFPTPLLHLKESNGDYRYEKKADWERFMKVFPDSSRQVLPLVENISRREARLLERHIKSRIDTSDNSFIVPWHSLFSEIPPGFIIKPPFLAPERLMNRCDICNSRLLALQVYIPHELRIKEAISYDPQLLYCEQCHKQVGITDGNEYINKTSVSKIPSQMIGFWENRNNPHIWTIRGPVRTVLEITEEGFVRIWSESLLWSDYEFEPKCLWINSSLTYRGSYYLMLDGDKLYTFREKYIYIHHVDYLSNKRLVLSDDCHISLNPNIPHIFRGSKESSVYHKIERPYSVFPNVHIGYLPNKQIRNIPSFWHRISDAIVLTDTAMSEEQKFVLDSLNIESHVISILKDSVTIDIQSVLKTLDIVHDAESKNNQVLILCDSEDHLLSKLIGECYHFLQTGELLDFGEILINGSKVSGSLIDYYHLTKTLSSVKFKSLSQ